MFAQLKNKLFGNAASKLAAKSRLHFCLVQDRSGLSNEEMVRFKSDLLEVIKRFFIIDDSGFEVEYKRETGSTTLLINSPVLRRKLAAAEAEAAKKAAKEAAKQEAAQSA